MKRSLALAAGCVVLASVGCGQTGSPTTPTAVRPAAQSLASPAIEGTSVNHTSGLVPFKGSLDGRYGTPSGEFPLIHESIDATGQATHLGQYALSIHETVNLLQASATGTFTFTAANGDTVFGSFTGQAQLGPLVQIIEEATVLGGTGRFAGAEGTFPIDRLFDPVNRTTSGSFDGTISSPGAAKQ